MHHKFYERRYPNELLALIMKKIDSNNYQNYVVNGVDVLNNGELSCAKFVSEILSQFNLISIPHATVESTIRDMRNLGWVEILYKNLKPGDVIVSDKDEDGHYHLSFYVGDQMAVGNSSKHKVPKMYHYEYNGRKVVKALALFWDY